MSNYGGYGGGGGGGGYGQTNPYASQGNRYDQGGGGGGGNPYAQSNPYAQAPPQQGGYGGQSTGGYGGNQGGGYGGRHEGGYDNRYGGQPQQSSRPPQGGAGGTYAAGNAMEMQPMNGQTAGRDPNAILNETQDIDRGIDSIQRNLERLQFLQQRSIDDPDASSATQTNRELDSLSNETMTLYRNFTDRLKSIKKQKESGNPRNAPQVGRVERKLRSAIQEYQKVEMDFRKKLQAQMARQYRIVRPDASEQEVQEAVEDTSNQQVFSQALMQSNRRGQAQSALRNVQSRHEAIQKIERQMVELAQLFSDMEQAVVEQEHAVEEIDTKGEQTVTNLDGGNKQLDQAVVKARAARKKKWICLGITILIILIIAAVIAIAVVVTNNNKKKDN